MVDDRTHRLYVEEVTFADEGEYTFEAGNQKATTFLYVQRKSTIRCILKKFFFSITRQLTSVPRVIVLRGNQ